MIFSRTEKPPEFIKKMEPANATVGESASFEIELSKGDVVTKWLKNGKELELNKRIKLNIDGKKQKLELNEVALSDEAEYSCVIATTIRSSAKLTVEEPKVQFVTKLPKTICGDVGQDVKIQVILTKPGAKISWQKNGQDLTKSQKYAFEEAGCTYTLVIRNATREDIAQYTCIAENVTTQTDLELQGGDEALEFANDLERTVDVTKGQDVTLTARLAKTALQTPNAQWFFQSTKIETNEKIQTKITRDMASISIRQAESLDCGIYTLKLWNSVSEISADFTVSIKDKPSPPRGPASVEWRGNDSMELRWNAPDYDGGSSITDFIVERREVGKKSWKQVGTSTLCVIEIKGLKKNSAYNFRIIAKNAVGLSEPFIIEETFSTTKTTPKSLPGSPSVQVTDVTSRSVTLQWSPPSNTGGVELTGYILEKQLATSNKWEKVATVDSSVTLFKVDNLKEKSEYFFRISAENEVGASAPSATSKVSLKTHARPPSAPTAPLEITSLGPHAIMVEWGAPESDGGAPLEGYKIAVRDARRQMWMEVGRVSADIQKLKVQDLAEGHEYFIRIFAKNEIGFSDPLENDDPFKVVRPADYTEEELQAESKRDETPSLSFTTETSSWMREANMDADIKSYTTSSVLRRDEYFFRIWYYAKKIFK
eukprot:snap_masked-scaffold1025_size69488-processed-gene-0.4 protein:Tk03097 transcript:snap_masked-scaffold1025_size69488-processed-gene-0.4-mRNA-1 annotation:"hypothetical protein D910_05908"